MATPHLKLIAPDTVFRTVATPRRKPNADYRTREYLTAGEVEALIAAAKGNRWGQRDAAMILVAYRHGLRVSELIDLRWDQIDFDRATLAVRRVKNGTPSTHPIMGDELRALRRLQREQEPKSPFVFTSERGSPFTASGFARWWSGPGPRPGSASRPILTCCATPAASPWPTRGTTRARCKPIWGIAIFSIRCATPSCRRTASRTSGAEGARKRVSRALIASTALAVGAAGRGPPAARRGQGSRIHFVLERTYLLGGPPRVNFSGGRYSPFGRPSQRP